MTDFTFSPASFNDTTILVVANTQAAKQFFAERFGPGCVSIQIRKSGAPDLAETLESKGYSFS